MAGPEGVITGTVTYLQRIALPPVAVIQVQLLDVSLQDVAAKVLASQRYIAGGARCESRTSCLTTRLRSIRSTPTRLRPGSPSTTSSADQHAAIPVLTRGAPTSKWRSSSNRCRRRTRPQMPWHDAEGRWLTGLAPTPAAHLDSLFSAILSPSGGSGPQE